MDEANEMFGLGGAMIYSACSRSLDPRSRKELEWKPVELDMLSQVGEARLRELAKPDQAEQGGTGHTFPGGETGLHG